MMLSDEDFDFVQRLLQDEAGLVLETDKLYLANSRLARLAQQQGEAGIASLLRRVREGSTALRSAVADAMTIQETYFFRDPWLFTSLREEALPALLAARAAERSLSIWCAASATGQEVYSLCLLLREQFPQLANWRLDILASDFSPTALAQAESGRYSHMEANRGLPAPLLVKYFRRQGTHWQLNDDVRRMVRFQRLNLVAPWPDLPRFDIVLLRNVLIYFDDATRRAVLTRTAQTLRRDGFLYMGGTESPLHHVSTFSAGADGRACHYRLL